MPKTSKHVPSDFDFCPKHKYSFYISCGCKRGEKKEKPEVEEIKENKEE